MVITFNQISKIIQTHGHYHRKRVHIQDNNKIINLEFRLKKYTTGHWLKYNFPMIIYCVFRSYDFATTLVITGGSNGTVNILWIWSFPKKNMIISNVFLITPLTFLII